MLDKTKPIVLSGLFHTNLKSILASNGYKIIPSLSKHSQLVIDSSGNASALLKEAAQKRIPIFLEADVLATLKTLSMSREESLPLGLSFMVQAPSMSETKLLVDKLAPTQLSHVIGHKEQIKELLEWLRGWPQKGAAVMISGPPGIGKTTCAHLIVKECGYFCKEYNASDSRNASAVNTILATDSYRMRREVIIMDEADGFDRGGVAALAARIRGGRVPPIICIANDRSSLKLKPILSVTADIRFARPVKTTIAKAIKERTQTPLTEQQLVELCERNGNDIRAIINSLQMESTTANSKDAILRQDMFSATQRLFNERRSTTLAEAEQLVFVDYMMVPLMVQECATATAKTDLAAACKAAELSSNLDLINTRIQREQAWHLLPDMAMNAVAIARSTAGPAPFNMFPQWLGKNSKRLKHRRQIHEIAVRSKHTATSLREDYWTPINVIASENAARPQEFIDFLETNRFTRDDYFETIGETIFDAIQIPTKEKTAITRLYNKQNKIAAVSSKKMKVVHTDLHDSDAADAETDDVIESDEEELVAYLQ
jgi:replication factor C subunit 1